MFTYRKVSSRHGLIVSRFVIAKVFITGRIQLSLMLLIEIITCVKSRPESFYDII